MLSKKDLEKLRSPKQLKQFVFDTYDLIKSDLKLRKEARLKKELYKYFVEELYPFSIFASVHYDEKCLCKPIIGNQGYDAEIYLSDKVVDKVEISWAIEGLEDYKIAKALNKQGYSEMEVVDDFTKQKASRLCLENMKKKALKDYSDCTLLLVYDEYPGFSIENRESAKLITDLVVEAKNINFKAKGVYLLLLPQKIIDGKGTKQINERVIKIQ
ncbi:hypothetical protein ACFL3C_04385 [Patescibacteria group bacterium]